MYQLSVRGLDMFDISKDQILYHGSKGGIDGDICPCSRVRCDFGEGFYMGTSLMQAKSLVSGDDQPYYYKLKFRLSEIDPDKILVLNDKEWLYSILSSRKSIEQFNKLDIARKYLRKLKKYDVIIGKIADDKMRQAINAFMENSITDEGLKYCIQSVDYGLQVVAKTDYACSLIEILEEKQLKGQELEQSIKYSGEMQRTCSDVVEHARMDMPDVGRRLTDIIKHEKKKEKSITL